MPIPIILPKFGFTLESCEILGWYVKPGDEVREGDPLADVETDKVNMDVESTADGTVFHLMYDVGDDVPVTEVIAFLLAPGEEAPADWQPPPQKHLNKKDAAPAAPPPVLPAQEQPAPTPAPPEPSPQPSQSSNNGDILISPVARRMAEENNLDLTTITGTGPRGRITKGDVEAALKQPAPAAAPTAPANGGGKVQLAYGKVPATPAARRIAAERGVDLTTVTGSGPGGRIQGDDVRAAQSAAPAPAPAAAQVPPVTPQPALLAAAPAAETEVIPLKGMRKRIAQRMQESFRDAPHIFFDATVDMRGILALRKRIKAQDAKLSVTSVVVKACAWTLMQHPLMNATFDGESIALYNTANIGVAVALENGLIVPVIQGADKLSLRQIQAQLTDLAGRARDGKIMPDEMQGGTFTVSNLGMFGVDRFTAIVNPPQVGIVAVGRTVEQFVPDESGAPVLCPQMNITVSADHRVVDGAQVAQFIGDLRAVLEDPMLLSW